MSNMLDKDFATRTPFFQPMQATCLQCNNLLREGVLRRILMFHSKRDDWNLMDLLFRY